MVSCSEDVGFAADCGLGCVSFLDNPVRPQGMSILPSARENVAALLLYF